MASRLSELIENYELHAVMSYGLNRGCPTSENLSIPQMSLVSNDFVTTGTHIPPFPSLDYYDQRAPRH